MHWREFIRNIVALWNGQRFLFPYPNTKLLRIYGSIRVEGRKANIEFGRKVKLKQGCVVVLSDQRRDSELVLGDNAIVEYGAYLNVHNGSIILSSNTFVGAHSVLLGKGGIVLSPWVMLGPGVRVFSSDHDIWSYQEHYLGAPEIKGKIEIQENVWVGSGATILKNSTIARGCVVAAGSVIKGNISDNTLVAAPGILAKPVRNIQYD